MISTTFFFHFPRYITEANVPMIFLRYLPKEEEDLPVPF